MRVSVNSVVFVMVDIQERFEKHIADMPVVIKNVNLLNKAAELLEIPLLVTEQNPAGLGNTLSSIYLPAHHNLMSKTRFSIFEPEIESYLDSLEIEHIDISNPTDSKKKKHIVLYGIETHVCICQSVMEALQRNYLPVVVADAVSSIDPHNKEIGLQRILSEGGAIVSTEMLLFELLKGSYHPHFKEISKLIKDSKK